MCFLHLFRLQSWKKRKDPVNCCKVPTAMKIDPPLPKGYTAWIHRAGWMLYRHEPTGQISWMHPGKLARLEARGLKGPGKIGPEMHIWEPNVNRGGHYIIDYGYPPMGRVVAAGSPLPHDFKEIDGIGFEAWDKKRLAESAAWHRENDKYIGPHVNILPPGYQEMKEKVAKEQGVWRPPIEERSAEPTNTDLILPLNERQP